MPRLFVAVACIAALCAAQDSMSVYFAAGFASHVSMTGAFQLAEARFSVPEGKLLSDRNITSVDAFMMGYVRVSPQRDYAIFAAQLRKDGRIDNNVVLYQVALTGDAEPTPLIPNQTSLLAPCQHPVGYPPCSQLDLFHPYYDDTGDDTGLVLFGYRAWTSEGFPSGNQALAVLHPDGRVNPLTFNASDKLTMDECPRFVPGSNGTEVVFIRVREDGAARQMAHLHVATGRVRLIEGPQPDGWGGCPAPVGRKYLYITDADKPNMEAVDVTQLPFQANVTVQFEVPRVATPSTVDSLSVQYCSHVSGRETGNAIACRTADNKVTMLDSSTGATRANFSMPVPKYYNWCMTPNSFHAWHN